MKKLLFVATLAVFTLLAACQGDTPAEEPEGTEGEAAATEEATTEEITTAGKYWQQIQNRDEWAIWPGTEAMKEGKSPHGAYLTTYVNEAALNAINEGADAMPEEALVVKENYMEDQTLAKITAMAKMGGDWYWMVYDAEGTVLQEGNLTSCIECHMSAEKDQLFYWKAE